jgi:uncharacterized protein
VRSANRRWHRSPERAELLALYAEADALAEGFACACTPGAAGQAADPQCCHFAVAGHEPYPTPVELEEIRHAMRAGSVAPRDHRKLPLANLRPCPLLADDGRCRIYGSRPFGCRTFFCQRAQRVAARSKLPRQAINAIGRRIADLSVRFAPRDPRPRALVRALLEEKRDNRAQ